MNRRALGFLGLPATCRPPDKRKAPLPCGAFRVLGARYAGAFVLFNGCVGPSRLTVREPDIGPGEPSGFNPPVDRARGLAAVALGQRRLRVKFTGRA